MTKYAGEEYLIVHRAWDFDDVPLTPADVTAVKIRIVGPDGTDVLAETPMVWDAPASRWKTDWKSPSVAGTYRVRCSVWGPDGEQAFEVRRLRLAGPSV